MHEFKLKIKDEDLIKENRQLRWEFQELSELTEKWFDEKVILLERIDFLEDKIRKIAEDNSSRILELEILLKNSKDKYEMTIINYERDKMKYQRELT